MMKRNFGRDTNAKYRIFVVLAAIGLSAFVLFGTKFQSGKKARTAAETSSAELEATETSAHLATPQAALSKMDSSASGAGSAAASPGSPRATSPTTQGPATTEEKASLDTLSAILFEESRDLTVKPVDFVNKLVRLGFQPMVAKDSSDEGIGSMIVVRTKNALPGTRYFHAQFFTDENGQFFPQHISFEFRPSQSMGDVVASLESRFGKLGRPTTNDGVWMTWKLPNDYSLWIKRLEPADLDGNPYNAYSPGDVNTLRVAIEKDVAGHEESEAL